MSQYNITMAAVTLENTISFTSIFMIVKVKTDETKSHLTPYITVPHIIMSQIYEKFGTNSLNANHSIQLLSFPNVVMDINCTSSCTASVWSKVADRDMSLFGDYTFAVEKFNDDFFDWYIVATCENSTLQLY